jgi:hypothetical protein
VIPKNPLKEKKKRRKEGREGRRTEGKKEGKDQCC